MHLSDRIAYSDSFGFQVKKIPPWRFEISESAVRDLSRDIVLVWNQGVHRFKSLSRGGDWIKFFKVQFYSLHTCPMPTKHGMNLISLVSSKPKKQIAGSLYLLKLIVSRSLAAFLFTGTRTKILYSHFINMIKNFFIH